MEHSKASTTLSLPFAAESSWMTNRWNHLKSCLENFSGHVSGDFNVGIGTALIALYEGNGDHFSEILHGLRQSTAKNLTKANTMSLQACHDTMLRLHAITEVELLSGLAPGPRPEKSTLMSSMERRLNVIGAFLSDKQFLLGLRRAAMQLSRWACTIPLFPILSLQWQTRRYYIDGYIICMADKCEIGTQSRSHEPSVQCCVACFTAR